MKRAEILEAAHLCVNKDRDNQYGVPSCTFIRIARLWNSYLNRFGKPQYSEICKGLIDERDVAAMLILVKLARIRKGKTHTDNWIDIAGYAACGGEVEDEWEEVAKANNG